MEANLPNFNQKTMSSLEIAELTGKPHNDVMKSIRGMEPAWTKVNGGKFSLVEYTDKKGEKRPCYELSKTECLYIATKFNDEARAKLVIRWENLETGKEQPLFKLPQTYSEALRLAAEQAEQIENQQKLLEAQIPKVRFADAISCTETNISIGDMAKILRQNGIDIGQNRFYDWLVDHKYLICRKRWSRKLQKHVNDYMPTQKAADLEIFFVNELPIIGSTGSFIKHTVKVNGKGQVYFINKFLKDKVA